MSGPPAETPTPPAATAGPIDPPAAGTAAGPTMESVSGSTGGSDPASAPAPALTLTNGTVRLGHRPVLRDVSLRVRPGDFLAVLGPNGSGKSTLLRALLGLVPLSSGEVRIYGVPVARFRDWQRIGYVPQRTGRADGVPATVGEVVASGRIARQSRFRPTSRRDRAAARAALEAVGLTDRRRDSVHELSGGQWRRVQIARALAGEPDVLIMDEPATGMDAESQTALAAALGRPGLTVVATLHEPGPLEPLITDVVVLNDGRLAEGPRRTETQAPHEDRGEAP